MRALALVFLATFTASGFAVTPTPCPTIYAKVHAKDADGGGFELTPVCPAGMEPDKARMPKALNHVSSYGEAINAVQEWPCKLKTTALPETETPQRTTK